MILISLKLTVLSCGFTIHTAGFELDLVNDITGNSIALALFKVTQPVTVEPSFNPSGGLVRPTFTAKVRVTGSA